MSYNSTDPGGIKIISSLSDLPDLTSTEPTANLKFIDGILHQQMAVTTFRDGRPVMRDHVWQSVPSEATHDQD